jgi:hypothetical protein
MGYWFRVTGYGIGDRGYGIGYWLLGIGVSGVGAWGIWELFGVSGVWGVPTPTSPSMAQRECWSSHSRKRMMSKASLKGCEAGWRVYRLRVWCMGFGASVLG